LVCEHFGETRAAFAFHSFQSSFGDEWSLKVLAIKDQFVLGLYRRELRAIRYLGQLDKIFGVPATTRNWNTITALARILQKEES
jgi:hypothetical protein